MKVAVKTLENKDAGDIELDQAVFGEKIEGRESLLHRAVHYSRNKARSGTHKVQTRGEVTGTGKKPWAQKGTGRARAGDLKRSQDRGGGVVFGPVVRSHATALPKKVRKLALKLALSSKAKNDKIIVLEDVKVKDHKTKAMSAKLEKLGLKNALVVTGSEVDEKFSLATRNIPNIDVLPSQGANVYDILRRDTLVLTKDAIESLTARLKG